MAKSQKRDLYFSKHIENAETPQAFIEALMNSPYKMHRREGENMRKHFNEMIESDPQPQGEQVEDTKVDTTGGAEDND